MGLFTIFHIFAILVIGMAAKCPDSYLRFTNQHTFCKPGNPNCKILKEVSSVSKADIDVILKQHNILRSKLATGKEKGMPTAGNMLEMVWDDELAAIAQQHANQCEFEHDCNDCRRVPNFSVGQNLGTDSITNAKSPPKPNWEKIVKAWYDEVKYFDKSYINPFMSYDGPEETTYGHFTQVAWADSWRIGCGYVQHKEGNKYVGLYTCDYGPGGNMGKGVMYKEGPTCSSCPANSCCDKSCGGKANYPGLCKITDNKSPAAKPPQGSFFFYCDFQNQKDCAYSADGANKWRVMSTLSGSYLSIILKGGEKSTLSFSKTLKASGPFCVAIFYRRGPNVAGQEDNNKAVETFTIVSSNYEVPKELQKWKVAPQDFNKFSMKLGWGDETKLQLTFSVPSGKPDQFFEINKVYASTGAC